ncbi:MAG: hypothetical protein ACXWHB_07550 [Usitatibacter sp.]
MIPLSTGTVSRVRALFPRHEHDVVARMLVERCGDNLPLVLPTFVALTERIRFAVLKLSDGDLTQLERHVHAAGRDWRDVLLAAGFGVDVGAHLQWQPQSREEPARPPFPISAPRGPSRESKT